MASNRKHPLQTFTEDSRTRQARDSQSTANAQSPITGRRRNPWGTNNPEDFKPENWPSEVEFASDFEDDNVDDSVIGAAPATERHKRRNSSRDDKKAAKKQSLRMPPFPDNLQIARPADRMLWVWRLEGKGWFTIRDEYENLCGEKWTENTMASRFRGMMEHFEKNKEATVMIKLIRYKLAADKELEPQLWKSVARQFEENDGERVSVRTIRKQYQILPVLGYNPRTDTKYYDPFQNIKMEDLREEADQGGLANISKEEMAALSGRTAAPGGKLVDYQSESD